MELVLDRFAVNGQDEAIDLATGDAVQLRRSTAGGASEQAIWAARCARFAALRHPAIARLVDYGISGEMRRVEAWAATAPAVIVGAERAAAIRSAEAFLGAEGLSPPERAEDAVFVASHGPVVVPDPACGIPIAPVHGAPIDMRPADLGVTIEVGPRVAALGDLFAPSSWPRTCAASLHGPDPMALDAAAAVVLRAARTAGLVPVSHALLRLPRVQALVRGRTLLIVVRGHARPPWTALLASVLRAPLPHVVLFVGPQCVERVHAVLVRRASAAALADGVRPATDSGAAARRIAAAARQADGLVSKFCVRLWGVDLTTAAGARSPRPLRAAETAATYDAQENPSVTLTTVVDAGPWPAAGELARLRSQARDAAEQLRLGRRASGARLLRQATAALARRGDWGAAADGAVALAEFLAASGHCASADAMIAEAHGWAARVPDDGQLLAVAVVAGRVRCDLGRLGEAQAILEAASTVARSTNSGLTLAAGVALARCLYWQGRYDEAWDCLQTESTPASGNAHAAAWRAMRSRIAAARGLVEEAIVEAAFARDIAGARGDARQLALAHYATALVQLAVGDLDQAGAAAARAVREARRAHHLMLGACARLLYAEVARRSGRRAAAARIALRFARLSGSRLPMLVRVRAELLRDAVHAADVTELAERRAAASGLHALTLFVPRRPPRVSRQAADEIAALLHCAHAAEHDVAVLTAVCGRLRGRLRATSVACFTQVSGQLVMLAHDGGRPDGAAATRVFTAGQLVLPGSHADRPEGGVPVRYAGRCVGALVVRWAPGVPVDPDDLAVLLTAGAAAVGPALTAAAAARTAADAPGVHGLLGVSAGIREVRAAVERAASAPFPVLIEGESGSGKELVARSLHRLGPRRDRTFCPLNCAALPDDLVESELFGHARGAFTGAAAERQGVFEDAHGGTLFLDEVGELSLRAQAKLLRAIQEGEIRRVGENVARRVDVRLVTATNRDLRAEAQAQRFRPDLLFRLDVIRIVVPPLRERREDLPLLVEHFWRDASARVGGKAVLSAATVAALVRHDWPGNVRELQNVLASLVVRAGRRGVVTPSALPAAFAGSPPAPGLRLDAARRLFEEHFIRAALVRAGGRRALAAKELGLSRQGLAKLMSRLGLEPQDA